jgi:uncharacterized protein (TIGR00255 family)
MPISSMTAFARATHESVMGTLSCELRSVNHRYLDLTLHLSDSLRAYEKEIRELLQKRLGRGKVDLGLRFQASQAQALEFAVNTPLIAKLSELAQTVSTQFSGAQLNLMDLLSWPGVLKSAELNTQDLKQAVMTVVEAAIAEFIETRQREGAGIEAFLKQVLTNIATHMTAIKARLPLVMQLQRDKILARFAELQLNLDTHRLEQEFVWLAQKTDIAEELQRLEAHVHEVERALNEGGIIGRRLDFLMQELNREANTIGSKSMDAEVTRADVELKVLIEQMREQVQNLE